MILSKEQAKAQLFTIKNKHSLAHHVEAFTEAEYKDLRILIDHIYQSCEHEILKIKSGN